MFRRTLGGIESQHHFYRVDLVVYCEGEQGDPDCMSHDELFWTRVFSAFDRRVHVKSVGSKADVLAIAHEIVGAGITTVIAALDADYDHYFRKTLDHTNVLYTFGYSWESDAVERLDFSSALSLFATIRDIGSARNEFDAYFLRMSRCLTRLCLLDLHSVLGPQKLFDRGKPNSIIDSDSQGCPKIRQRAISRASKIARLGAAQPDCFPLDLKRKPSLCFYGKSIAKLVYRWFVWFSSRYKARRLVNYDLFLTNLIENMKLKPVRFPSDSYYARCMSVIP